MTLPECITLADTLDDFFRKNHARLYYRLGRNHLCCSFLLTFVGDDMACTFQLDKSSQFSMKAIQIFLVASCESLVNNEHCNLLHYDGKITMHEKK